jgi:hypothetical protein
VASYERAATKDLKENGNDSGDDDDEEDDDEPFVYPVPSAQDDTPATATLGPTGDHATQVIMISSGVFDPYSVSFSRMMVKL